MTAKKYKLIYADPPWKYKDSANAGKRGAVHKYNVMNLEELKSLPIPDLADDDCLLAMWWVAPMPKEAIQLVEAWGFTLKTMKGFTWHKKTKNGFSHFGMGHYTRTNTEDCLFATKGKPVIASRSVRQFIEEVIRDHSRKPIQARDRLVELLGDVPRVELFARESFSGWDAYGNEVSESICLTG